MILSTPLVAPSGGFVFDISSNDPSVASVPAQVTVPQGSSSVAVPVTGGSTDTATVTATRPDFLDAPAHAAPRADILVDGHFTLGGPLRAEKDEPELADLPRLCFNFTRHNLGRLRQLIDWLNCNVESE